MPYYLIKTGDGSHTIFSSDYNDLFHSVHGAIQESSHIFINSGLKSINKKNCINILEIGLGTGLNAFLTLIESNKSNIKINYTAIEPYPLHRSIYLKLNYAAILNAGSYKNYFYKIHTSEPNKNISLSETFILHKIIRKVDEVKIKKNCFHLIYFDTFGPEAQPELWTEKVFTKLFDSLINNGFLITYSAKGSVKRKLEKVGFKTNNIPGPPGKREILRATKRIF